MTTVQSAYAAKMAARFATFDRDGDGVVDVADFEEMTRAIMTSCGRLPESSEGMRLLDGARIFFAGLLEAADTDAGGSDHRVGVRGHRPDALAQQPGGL
ncbi:hypothetical protein [Lentzea jiangxiensis]|uniref:hypothetical protein n=1 Tax=Lentzea jiangxiensis TaxID=641025 RepID=UPI00115FC670|nr:hypothetical protein [Lentzea jiangxiensis]